MIPGFGKMDPKKIQGMMSKMGIQQEPVEAVRVIIEKEDGRIVIENPNVTKINMQGNESWQIMGDVKEEESSGVREEDVKLVMEKTGKNEKESRKALEDSGGDIAEAIVKLS